MKYYLSLLLIFLFASCKTSLYDSAMEQQLPGVDNNVCKQLRGRVILYIIFVDSKNTIAWSSYDIRSTMDSVNKAINWLEKEAQNKGVSLTIKPVYHQEHGIYPVKKKLPKKTLAQTCFSTKNGLELLGRWSDEIAKTAMRSLGKDTSKITKTKIRPSDKESLVERLRDIYKTDNIALMYMLNNNYKNDISVTVNTTSSEKVEYSVVSFKYPGVIAHEFLHLFGAWDLYITPFDKKRKAMKRKAFVMKTFPNEIMAFPYREISTLNISSLTDYLIGWSNTLDEKDKELITKKKIKVARY